MHYLFVSPTPPFPETGGNRAVVQSMLREIRKAGHRISFVYSTQEDCVNSANLETLKLVDAYYISLYYPTLRQQAMAQALIRISVERATFNYELDSWYSEDVSDLIRYLYERDPFDVMVGNYIWMSKAFECVPDHVIKIQQTHDAFTDRMVKLAKQGLPPSFFSTTREDEAKGLDRADINIALQYGEELYFRTLTDKAVFTMQHAVDERRLRPPRTIENRKLRVGFIGSDNDLNIKTLTTFVDCLSATPAVSDRIELCVVGTVCRIFATTPPPPFVRQLGVLPDLSLVYDAVDVTVNPIESGTGLKIKCVESMQFHCPVITTECGSDGLLSPYHFHCCRSYKEIMGYMKMVIDNPKLLDLIQSAGDKVIHAYRARYQKAAAVLTDPKTALDGWRQLKLKACSYSRGGRNFSFCGLVDDGEIESLNALLPENGTLVDIGSQSGVFAILAAHARKAKSVVAVEFDPEFIEQMKQNVIDNGFQDIVDMRLLGFAAGAAPGYGILRKGAPRSQAVFRDDEEVNKEATIPFIQMDRALAAAERVDIVRINAANAADILQGLETTIRKFNPVILIRAQGTEDIAAWATRSNYRLEKGLLKETLVFRPSSGALGSEIGKVA